MQLIPDWLIDKCKITDQQHEQIKDLPLKSLSEKSDDGFTYEIDYKKHHGKTFIIDARRITV